jgi:hypothetical protein
MQQKLPKDLQPVLWSIKIEDLDLKKDKIYIIHQILAFGNLKQLKWLFKNYSLNEIRKVFQKYPLKVYRPQSFNFVREILLKMKGKINEKNYVTTFLRTIE